MFLYLDEVDFLWLLLIFDFCVIDVLDMDVIV